MEYKVLKKFFNPFNQKRYFPNETIEIEDKYIENFKEYIDIPKVEEPKEFAKVIFEGTGTIELKAEETKEIPELKVIEKPKRTKKSGGK